MVPFILSVSWPLVAAITPIVLFLVYQSLRPHPLPQIPIGYPKGFNHVPWFMGFASALAQKMDHVPDFFDDIGERHGPVCQVIIGPAGTWFNRLFGFGATIIICTDSQETEDACGRRSAVFAKGPRDLEPWKACLPQGQIALPTGPQHRAHRRIFGPSMTGPYLAQMLPRIETSTNELLDLWQTRSSIARKRGNGAFEARQDFILATMDVIGSITFAQSFGGIKSAHQYLKDCLRDAPQVITADSRPPVPRPTEATLILLAQAAAAAFAGPTAKFHTFFAKYFDTKFRAARRDLVHLVASRFEAEQCRRLEGRPSSATAADHVLAMVIEGEAANAAKGNPSLGREELVDEMLTYIIGGAETTAQALAWSVKFLARRPDVQKRVRHELSQGLPAAMGDGSGIQYEDIQSEAKLPYFHAVVYECLRQANVAGAIGRTTLEDTTLLGYPIPKGTVIVFNTSLAARCSNDGRDRELAEQATKQGRRRAGGASRKWGWWDEATVREFRPERWLKTVVGPDGKQVEVFDKNAGPWQVFGAGAERGCFGKNLGLLEVKVFLAKLLGSFHLDSVPPELDSDGYTQIITTHPHQTYCNVWPVSEGH